MSDKDWAQYEQRVYQCFKDHFPHADIKKNVRIKGRYSNRLRQIDILIIEDTPAGKMQIVVDAKLHKRKLGIKDVEQFEGLVEDVGAEKGLLISYKGYSKPALRRAFYCPKDLELDILDFSELPQWQAFSAVPYSGDYAFLVPAPFGWVIDMKNVKGCLCNMFQRGLDFNTAKKNKEFLYINIWHREKDNLTAEELDNIQIENMLTSGMKIEVSHLNTIKRNDAKTRIRRVNVTNYKCLEVTGYLEFEKNIFYAVLLTSVEKSKQNIRRLKHIMQSAIPVELTRDNLPLIKNLKQKLLMTKSNEEKSKILLDIGHWYRDMKQFKEAKKYLEKSVSLIPYYYNLKELIWVLIELEKTNEAKELIHEFLKLDLTNPAVFNDALTFSHEAGIEQDLVVIFDELIGKEDSDSLVKANCLFYSANIELSYDINKAKKRLNESRRIFRKVLPAKHQVFKTITLLNKQIKNNGI